MIINHHYISRGDFQMKNNEKLLWELFRKTGDIKYYNMLQELRKK